LQHGPGSDIPSAEDKRGRVQSRSRHPAEWEVQSGKAGNWSQLSDLNRRPTLYESVALPLS
jgi:hypothetical protein